MIIVKPMTVVAMPPPGQGGNTGEDSRPKSCPINEGAFIEELLAVLHEDGKDNKIHDVLEGGQAVLMVEGATWRKDPSGIFIQQDLDEAVEGHPHYGPDNEAQVILATDEIVGDPEGHIGADDLADPEHGELGDEGGTDSKKAIGQVKRQPDLIGITGVEGALLPPGGLVHRHDHGDGKPIRDAELQTSDIPAIQGIAEEGHFYRVDGHEPDPGHTDAIHPGMFDRQRDGNGQEADR